MEDNAKLNDDALRKESWVEIKHKMNTIKVPTHLTLERLLWILFILGDSNGKD